MPKVERLFRADEAARIAATWDESSVLFEPEKLNDRIFHVVKKHNWQNTRLEFRVGILYRIDRRWVLADGSPICKPVHELDEMFRQFELDPRYPDHEIGTVYGRLPGQGAAVYPLVGIFDNIRAVVEARKRYARPIAGWAAKDARMQNIGANMRGVQRSQFRRMKEIEALINQRRRRGRP